MNTATELMRRALESLEEWKEERNATCDDVLIEEIRAYLAAEPEAEPVFIRPDHLALARKSPFLCQVGPVQVADFVPLYTRPEPARKPMSEEIEEMCDTREFDQIQGGMREAFYFGVRWAEKHHGIGKDDE